MVNETPAARRFRRRQTKRLQRAVYEVSVAQQTADDAVITFTPWRQRNLCANDARHDYELVFDAAQGFSYKITDSSALISVLYTVLCCQGSLPKFSDMTFAKRMRDFCWADKFVIRLSARLPRYREWTTPNLTDVGVRATTGGAFAEKQNASNETLGV